MGERQALEKGFLDDKTEEQWKKMIPFLLLNVIMFTSDMWDSGTHFVTMRAHS